MQDKFVSIYTFLNFTVCNPLADRVSLSVVQSFTGRSYLIIAVSYDVCSVCVSLYCTVYIFKYYRVWCGVAVGSTNFFIFHSSSIAYLYRSGIYKPLRSADENFNYYSLMHTTCYRILILFHIILVDTSVVDR